MVDERKRKREYKMLKEKLNVKKKIEKLKELDDDEIELMGIQFINKGKHLRAQAFVLKLLFIFNAILLPSNFFMNIHWIAYVSNHAYIFNILLILFGELFYYLYSKFVTKEPKEEENQK